MKEESPVIADENVAVKRYSAFVHTARRVLEAKLRKEGKSFARKVSCVPESPRVLIWQLKQSRNKVIVRELAVGILKFISQLFNNFAIRSRST